jgi:hypothetical protein
MILLVTIHSCTADARSFRSGEATSAGIIPCLLPRLPKLRMRFRRRNSQNGVLHSRSARRWTCSPRSSEDRSHLDECPTARPISATEETVLQASLTRRTEPLSRPRFGREKCVNYRSWDGPEKARPNRIWSRSWEVSPKQSCLMNKINMGFLLL